MKYHLGIPDNSATSRIKSFRTYGFVVSDGIAVNLKV